MQKRARHKPARGGAKARISEWAARWESGQPAWEGVVVLFSLVLFRYSFWSTDSDRVEVL
jgi:hypothetical protein